MAKGAKAKDKRNIAPIMANCPAYCKFIDADSTADVAKINNGINTGNNNKANKTPPRFNPTVSPTAMAPIKLNIGVPINKVKTARLSHRKF